MTTRVPHTMTAAGGPVSPETYGAVGNGTTDDATALNLAATAAGTWGHVFLNPAKTYLIGSAITPLSGQRWYGGGKVAVANGFNFNAFDLSGKTDVTIEGLRGESGTLGVAYSSATARFVAAKSGRHRCKVLHCHVTGFQSAVQFNNSTDCKAVNNTIVNPYGWGVNVQTDADFAEVRGNRISGAVAEHGVYVAGSSGNLVRGVVVADNWISGCLVNGIKTSYADDARVSGNRVWQNADNGVYVTIGSDRVEVKDNVVWANGGNGIEVYDDTATSTRNRILSNVVRSNDKNGISVTAAGGGTVSQTWVQDNDVDDNDQDATTTYYGITLGGGAGNVGAVVRFNRVSNETIGVRVAASVPAAVIGRNIYVSCGTGTSDAGSATVIET